MLRKDSKMKVSIITAFFCGKRYIDGLLKSVYLNAVECKKVGVEIEYIIVNDSPEIEMDIKNPYSNFFDLIVLINQYNSGIHQTRVNGLNASSGVYVLMFDQDDRLLPNAILSCLKSINNADMVVGNGYNINGDNRSLIYRNRIAQKMATREIFYAFCTSMCVSPGHVLIKAESIPEVWKRNIMTNNGSDDYFLWLLMVDNNCKININTETIYEHIGTNENLSLDRKKMYYSSMNFCNLATEKQLLSPQLLRKINRRTKMKIRWKFDNLSWLQKIRMIIKNIDIFAINVLYRMNFK